MSPKSRLLTGLRDSNLPLFATYSLPPRHKGQETSMRRYLTLSSVIAVLIVGTGLLYYRWLEGGGVFRLENFDREKWVKSVQEFVDDGSLKCLPSARMAGDLEKRVIQPGMSRGELIALLGGYETNESSIRFVLGACMTGLQAQDLVIYFDGVGKVTRAQIESRPVLR